MVAFYLKKKNSFVHLFTTTVVVTLTGDHTALQFGLAYQHIPDDTSRFFTFFKYSYSCLPLMSQSDRREMRDVVFTTAPAVQYLTEEAACRHTTHDAMTPNNDEQQRYFVPELTMFLDRPVRRHGNHEWTLVVWNVLGVKEFHLEKWTLRLTTSTTGTASEAPSSTRSRLVVPPDDSAHCLSLVRQPG